MSLTWKHLFKTSINQSNLFISNCYKYIHYSRNRYKYLNIGFVTISDKPIGISNAASRLTRYLKKVLIFQAGWCSVRCAMCMVCVNAAGDGIILYNDKVIKSWHAIYENIYINSSLCSRSSFYLHIYDYHYISKS